MKKSIKLILTIIGIIALIVAILFIVYYVKINNNTIAKSQGVIMQVDENSLLVYGDRRRII